MYEDENMVVDFHVHCFPDELAARAVLSLGGAAGITPRTDGTVSGIRKKMREAGVDISVVLPIATKPSQTSRLNDWAVSVQSDDIIAFGSVHPDFGEWKSELERLKALGIRGIKLHPDYQHFYVDDPKMFPLFEYAFGLGMILIFHAGVDIGLKPPYHCTPARLARVLDSFPGGTVIAAHMGGYDCWDAVEAYLVGREVYFDTSYSLKGLGNERTKRIIARHGYEKILFATDSPWADQREELELIKGLGLEDRAEKAIVGENAARLLGMGDKKKGD